VLGGDAFVETDGGRELGVTRSHFLQLAEESFAKFGVELGRDFGAVHRLYLHQIFY
jgi:hypothetical protein